MNNFEFNILRLLKEGNIFNAETFGKILFHDSGEVEEAYSELERDNFVIDKVLTRKAEELLEAHRINNAIILAAGMSRRFVPLSFELPKGLLNVKGEVLTERQIRQLKEKNIHEIIIVVGHMKEHFEYLREKFGVILVEAEDYAEKNNHASEQLNSAVPTINFKPRLFWLQKECASFYSLYIFKPRTFLELCKF